MHLTSQRLLTNSFTYSPLSERKLALTSFRWKVIAIIAAHAVVTSLIYHLLAFSWLQHGTKSRRNSNQHLISAHWKQSRQTTRHQFPSGSTPSARKERDAWCSMERSRNCASSVVCREYCHHCRHIPLFWFSFRWNRIPTWVALLRISGIYFLTNEWFLLLSLICFRTQYRLLYQIAMTNAMGHPQKVVLLPYSISDF